MPGLLPRALGRSAGDTSFTIFLVTVALCLLRSVDLPSVQIGVLDVTLADVALLTTGVLALNQLRTRPLPSRWLLVAAAAFGALIAVSSLANGSDAVTAAGKLVELGLLGLGAAVFIDSPRRLRALLVLVVAFAAVATAWGLIGFLTSNQERQGSFMGEHDLAALATLAAAIGLERVHSRRGNPGRLAIVGLVIGVIGTILGAALASLIGIYLASLVMLLLARRRGDLRWTAALVTLAVAGISTAGTVALRGGDLGFLQSWFGPPAEQPGQYASSWSQRLIFTYVGGRIFLDQPVLGTGWYGLLPPEEFARYLPDARERFSDQPAHYFPPADGVFIPQQAYDQVLFELGLVGAGVLAVLLALAGWRAAVVSRRRDPDAAYIPALWLAAILGALAGAALFGGAPLTAMFWLALGVVASEPEPVTA
jgi:O-Antigen ligase